MIIKNFSGGQSSDDQVGIKGAYKIGRNLDTRKKTDSLSCGNALSLVTGLTNERVNVFVDTPNGAIYAFCQSGKIYVGNSTGSNWSLSCTDTDGIIYGASIYDSGTSTDLYYIIGDSTSKKLKKATIVVSLVPSLITSWTQNMPTTINPMLQVMDRLMFSTGNNLGMVEQDGSSQLAVELFPINTTISAMGKTKDYLILGFYAPNQTETYIKVVACGDDVAVEKTIPVLTSNIEAIIKSPEDLLVFAGGILYSCDLTDVYALKELNGNSNNYAVCSRNKIAHIGISKTGATLENEGVFSYGRVSLEKSKTLNNDFYYNAQETISMTSTISNNLVVCYNDGGIYKTFYENIALKALSIYETLDIYPIDALTPENTIKNLKVVMKKMSVGCKVRIGLIPDKEVDIDNVKWLKDMSGIEYIITTNAKVCYFPINAQYDILNLVAELTPSGVTTPEIYALIIS